MPYPRLGPARAPSRPVLGKSAGAVAATLVIALLAAAGGHAAQPAFPELTGRVVDGADILSSNTERTLSNELAGYERASGGTQVVVATIASLDGMAIDTYGYQLGRHWGIGAQGEDTGALLIVAPAERQIRIEVGYGLEGQLTDAVSWDIIQGRILPQFRQGDFDAGVIEGTRAMLAALGGEYQPAASPQHDDRRRAPALGIAIFVLFIILSSFSRRGRGRGLTGALLLGSMLGGGRGGGGFGGGGFSGGGGSFGGGGASGGW